MTQEEKMFEAVCNKEQSYFKKLPEKLDINAQDQCGDTLLHKLAKTAFVPIYLGNILKRNPNPFIENKDGMTPRMLAVWASNPEQASFLAAYEASYREKQSKYQTIQNVKAISALATMLSIIADQSARSSAKAAGLTYVPPIIVISAFNNIQNAMANLHRSANGRID